jgi:hypothetical protein
MRLTLLLLISFGRGDSGIRWIGGRTPRGSRAAILPGASVAGPRAEIATPVAMSNTARATRHHAPADLEMRNTLVSMFPPLSRYLRLCAAAHVDVAAARRDRTSDKPTLCELSRIPLDLSKRILLQVGREKTLICRGSYTKMLYEQQFRQPDPAPGFKAVFRADSLADLG